jgi:hypothetical protein
MTNREKIIVGLAALALGYGAMELLLPRAKVAPVSQQDPFLEIQKAKAVKPPDKPTTETARLPNLVYNGFMELGSKRLAIINGQEYEAGDKLNPGGFTIKSILPTRVVLVSAQGEGAPIVLPLQESE